MLFDLLEPLVAINARAGRRQLVWLQGEADWARTQAADWLRDAVIEQPLWVGAAAPDGIEALAAPEVQRRLGSECGALVFDAFSGFNPNAFGQAVGTLRGGALALLLTPPADSWRDFDDPEHAAIAVYPYSADDVGRRFLAHLVTTLEADSRVIAVAQGQVASPLPLPDSPVPAAAAKPPYRTADQRHAVDAVLAALEVSVPLVLTADRGRGKSASLGLAAARWLLRNEGTVLVTAPTRAAAAELFARLHDGQPGEHRGDPFDHPRVRYFSPERLLHGEGEGELLLVDEAAAIPAPVLSGLLARFPRIVFATTVHGYEGTGRGFAVRFRRELQRRAPNWREVRMQQPVRWCQGDPLEELSFRMLMLDAEAAPARAFEGFAPGDLSLCRLDRDRLLTDAPLLSELFGLLVLAHYRTTPGDLRILLDSPNLAVWTASCNGHLAAAMLVVEEGDLPADLVEGIYQGRRRPPGHLIPQALIGQEGLCQAGDLRALRIMRIATHPMLERRGIASRLLGALADWARPRHIDYLGTCFGATEDLLSFWTGNDYLPVRLGAGRDPVGGTFAVILLAPLGAAARELLDEARERLRLRLLHQLPAQLADLDARLVASLLPSTEPIRLSQGERMEIEVFAHHNRAFESCEPALWKLCSAGPESWIRAGLDQTQQQLLIRVVLQRHSWERLAAVSAGGRRAQVRALRAIMARLLESRGEGHET
ncbi:tRNA(Met) cytidine acetyltransferase TmcA [Marinobacterium nitratireducens]|uniref:tRNA(Met) cytidine acetyltransferase TmcA n=1 Tax=Marinobacterium nitratireducens TaxID=518897 RepID=A0A918DQM1_9GAMM|nr:GNAT family N-acetyltransferase [Marinobacterium nitratireducens]GGO79633.1 tRNA(Met) cytidine acetyltransferase TmcA [Marinobacterium nitratireducens]